MKRDNPITDEERALIPRALTHEIYLLYTMTMALDTMVFDIERRFRKVNETYHFEKDAKRNLNRYFNLLEQCKSQYENFICPSIVKVAAEDNYETYEGSRVFSQELIRLLMLYYTQCGNKENHVKVFEFISSLEGGSGVFTTDDINRFDLGCK